MLRNYEELKAIGSAYSWYSSKSIYRILLKEKGKEYSIKKLEKLKISINEHLKEYIYDIGYNNIENIVIDNLSKENLTLSTAESCTGGLIGHRLTEVSGSSAVYAGGVISYSNESYWGQKQ